MIAVRVTPEVHKNAREWVRTTMPFSGKAKANSVISVDKQFYYDWVFYNDSDATLFLLKFDGDLLPIC